MLATPYSLDYDLMLLAPAIAFLAADGMRRGFAPWRENRAGGAVARSAGRPLVAQVTLIPLAVPMMVLAFVLLLQRVRAQPQAKSAAPRLGTGPDGIK